MITVNLLSLQVNLEKVLMSCVSQDMVVESLKQTVYRVTLQSQCLHCSHVRWQCLLSLG